MSATDLRSAPLPTRSRRFAGGTIAILLIAGVASAGWYLWIGPEAKAERLLSQARSLHLAGREKQAEERAAAALKLDRRLHDAALLAARSAIAQSEFERAAAYLEQAAPEDPRGILHVRLLAARLYHTQLHQLSAAERHYRTALTIDPGNSDANEGLAKLLGVCARRTEAIPHVLRLVRAGKATDLLVMLARQSGIVNDSALVASARRAAPEDPNPLLALAWQASEEESGRAIELLREAIRRKPDFSAAHVALGRQLLAAGRLSDLADWNSRLPSSAEAFAETWLVRAEFTEGRGDVEGAIRCYWESVRRAPESKAACIQLARLLVQTGQDDRAEPFSTHARRLVELEALQDRILFSGREVATASLLALVEAYVAAGRLWEACGWCRMAVEFDAASAAARQRLLELRREVDELELRLTADSANVALRVDLSKYPVPRIEKPLDSPPFETQSEPATLSFRNDAALVGLRFRFFNGTAGPPTRRMSELTGGGVGVLDFDLDGCVDIYFTQGRSWPPGVPAGGHVDRLFRNCQGARFEEVTASARISEADFGQGTSVGDVDVDGFPDLYVANIGPNQLWRNNGDGTFSNVTGAAGLAGDEWTTSCAVADLNGDALPDLYDVNYLTGNGLFERICTGSDGGPAQCLPTEFDGQPDRLWLNDGSGGFADATSGRLSAQPNGKGLGVAVWDAHGTGQLSLFVANDTTPNFFFVSEASESGDFRLEEVGFRSGLAVNGEGKATGCMGVAVGDVNDDGRMDLHVTNFLAEPNTLYLSVSDALYDDGTRPLGLYTPSLNVLGFGTQFLDADLDGRLELFVSNGHVDDLRQTGRPYKMRPQLLRRVGRQFEEGAAEELGPYFEDEWLGRPAARLDWNGDGREDLVVGHLDADSALLTNTTPEAGNALSLRLFGVRSNRDAIGATVEARIGERIIVRQLTAGDGYQASNERRVILGTGAAAQIDELIVRWPSGTVQKFDSVAVPRDVLVREGGPLLDAPQRGLREDAAPETPAPRLSH